MRLDKPRDPIAGPDAGPEAPFPIKVNGKVVKGFGRGSKDLGIPTANIPIDGLSVGGNSDVESGIYYGWAGLEDPPVAHDAPGLSRGIFPMVMSIGWNPFYKNAVRSVEVHIMAPFTGDFYDHHLNLIILGYIRPEYDYISKESLIEDIQTDIEVARRSLAREAYAKWTNDPYLHDFKNATDAAQ
ncbi:riboflavin kinase [Xylona heveae TC161]|uniref:Riboflavin kinase n=1 Tax=Xylona heveae (strain CBS 132557 / TC161) TaxID=1328760 RepID=A0A165FY78_XYLHT|nr:riboflavin kinase [Xylona heveae TC161]KZF21525.1 riboflavin kinase [Xylona heveae TC161]